jgi:CRISPR-associated protein Csm1
MGTKEKEQLLLAALLHDIGKFWQRADAWLGPDSAIKVQDEAHLRELVPYNQNGRPKHQHAIWTYQFMQDKRTTFERLGVWETPNGTIDKLAARHHLPTTEAERWVQLADHWSSGIDRRKKNEAEDAQDWGKYGFRATALRSPFGRLLIDGQQGAEDYTAFRPMDIEEKTVFPASKEGVSALEKQETAAKAYLAMWADFYREFDLIPTENTTDFTYTLLHLLRKYCWCIPSDTLGAPIVNLYEHLKTTAGLAACLHGYGEAEGITATEYKSSITTGSGKDSLLMVCLDLSGIQAFIYDISSKKAYKSLKGRSYFLQALLSRMVNTLLKETTQSRVNVLYESGGKAYLLLPNTNAAKAGMERAKTQMEDQAYYEEGGKIYPAMGACSFYFTSGSKQPVRSTDLKNGKGDLGDLWKTVSDAAAKAKNQRYKRLLTTDFPSFFKEDHKVARLAAEAQKICAVSGVAITGKGKLLNQNPSTTDANPAYVTERVHLHTELGRQLKESNYVLSGYATSQGIPFKYLDQSLALVNERDARSGQQRDRLNDTDFLPIGATEGGYGFSFYGGNTQPEGRGGDPAMLEDLCEVGEDKYAKLGVLRMDVDSLGQLFISGLAETDKSFAAYATLSAQLELFFSGYLNTIREEEEFTDQLTILYSGGDDIFALGRWDKALAFARRVHEDFRRFVGRDDLTISAGLVLVDHKFPIYRAAAMAGDAEKKAKEHEYKKQKKNAINLFGLSLNWDGEYPVVEQLKNELVAHTTNGLSRALLHRLREAYASSQPDPITKAVDLSYKWQTAYALARMTERYQKKVEIESFLKKLNSDLMHHAEFGANHYLTLAAAAARWAEYELNLIKNE